MKKTSLIAAFLLMAFTAEVHQANAVFLTSPGQGTGPHASEAGALPLVPAAVSVPTNGEKRILRAIRSHNKKMKGLSAKMGGTIRRLKRINAKF